MQNAIPNIKNKINMKKSFNKSHDKSKQIESNKYKHKINTPAGLKERGY